MESVLFDLHRLDDLCLGAVHHVDTIPQLAQRSVDGLACTVKLKVDDDTVGIAGWPEKPVAAHARALTADGIVVEGLFEGVEIGNCVLEPQYVHQASSTLSRTRDKASMAQGEAWCPDKVYLLDCREGCY